MTVLIPRPQPCSMVFVCGPVSSGKTWLLKKLVSSFERSLTVDVMAEYDSPDYEHIWSNPVALCDRLESNPHYYRLVYHVNAAKTDEDFKWCFSALWSAMRIPRWFVLEECQLFAPVAGMNNEAENLLRYGRHNLIGILAASQRIVGVSKLLTGGARMSILFKTSESADLDEIDRRWGGEIANAVQDLRPCIYNDATKEVLQHPQCVVIARGEFKVVDLGTKIQTEIDQQESQWHELLQEEQMQQPQPYSEQNSGSPEQSLPESTSEASQQNLTTENRE